MSRTPAVPAYGFVHGGSTFSSEYLLGEGREDVLVSFQADFPTGRPLR